MTNLIARFVFDKGDPVDVRLSSEQKEEFLNDMRDGKFFHDDQGEGVFYANLDHTRFFFISHETKAPPPPTEVKTDEEVKAEI